MEPQAKPKVSVKDFFLNIGAIIALYTVVVAVVNLLFTVINAAYPQITTYYSYNSSSEISWPVSLIIIFTPIFLVLMWLLQKDYERDPERKTSGIHKWLGFITLFLAGLTIAGDLVEVLYAFLNGEDLTTAFLLKVLVVFVVGAALFMYYISDIRGKLTSQSRKIWRIVALVLIVASIAWGFSVLGSPRTQRLIKYDEQKVSDLQNLNSEINSYVQMNSGLPATLLDLSAPSMYFTVPVDPQSHNQYEYKIIGQSAKAYELCATFNKETTDTTNLAMRPYIDSVSPYGGSWGHPAGHHCFSLTVPVNQYPGAPKAI